MGRRGHGEGTVFLDKKSGLYFSRFNCIDPKTGLTVRKSFQGTKNKRETMEIGRQRKAEFEQLKEDPVPEITLAVWVNTWLEYKRPLIRDTTYQKYETCMLSYIVPKLGTRPLSAITAMDIDDLFTELQKTGGKKGQGISKATIDRTRCYLKQFLDWAVKRNIIQSNNAHNSRPIRQERKNIHPLNQQQANVLLEHAKEINEYAYTLIMITLYSGMRRNEVFGLTWDCVDFQRNEIRVTKQLRLTRGNNGEIFAPPKTDASRRNIKMSPGVMAQLQLFKNAQDVQRTELGSRWIDNNLVFPNLTGMPANPKNFMERTFIPLCRKVGTHPDFTFHDLRHTHATLMLLGNVHPKMVSERLGHSSIKITLDTYSHVLPSMQEQAVIVFDALLAKKGSDTTEPTSTDPES